MQTKMFENASIDKSTITMVADYVSLSLRELNFVSFSGGKDSTTVLQIVLSEFIKYGHGRLYIMTADTMMEIPYFQTYVDGVRGRLIRYIESSGINAEVVTVRPSAKNSFWVSVLGKGYPASSMGFRWCTGRLKIEPLDNFVKAATCGNDYMVFVGVRSAESKLRAKIYKRKDYKPHHYAPILEWSSHDVWEYLLTEPCPWGDDHADLIKVYRFSSDECVYGESAGVCIGNARYGCWACPLQKSSQLDMVGHNTNDLVRYQKLKQFKENLVRLASDRNCRSRIRRNGDEGTGPFLVDIRKKLFSDLKRVESETGWNLIAEKEEIYIKEHWEVDSEIHNQAASDTLCEPLFKYLKEENRD